jgi:hypothetical protein
VNVSPCAPAPAAPPPPQARANTPTPPNGAPPSLEQLLGTDAAAANQAGRTGPPPHSMAMAQMVGKNAQRQLREALADEVRQRREIRGAGLNILA